MTAGKLNQVGRQDQQQGRQRATQRSTTCRLKNLSSFKKRDQTKLPGELDIRGKTSSESLLPPQRPESA
ncbi:hypothetical protein NQZ68_010388 [Dissostichus eleginoides]|nr:hypothetical protein NQZ68_010388 [Dissostichus eleginoides]